MPIQITIGGRVFPSKKALTEAIRNEVHPFIETMTSFESPLMSDLFAERHYGMVQYGVRPIAYHWDTHPRLGTKSCFVCHFDDPRFPFLRERPASYNKAIDDWRFSDDTLDGELAREYRLIIGPFRRDYLLSHPQCEWHGCFVTDDVEVHHVDPTFKEIAAVATALLSTNERAALIASYDWLRETPCIVPDECRRSVIEAHITATLMTLCKQHHYRVKLK